MLIRGFSNFFFFFDVLNDSKQSYSTVKLVPAEVWT